MLTYYIKVKRMDSPNQLPMSSIRNRYTDSRVNTSLNHRLWLDYVHTRAKRVSA